MSEDTANLLMQTLPDRGPGRTIMGMIASVVAITTSAATYLFGASHPEWGAGILILGLALGVVFFFYFKSHILDEQCFSASLPFELKFEHAQEAIAQMERLLKECAPLISSGRIRANIFRPSDEYQTYGCACILKIDPRLALGMSDEEINSIRFLPGQGHTGKVFVTTTASYGKPDVAITKEQLAHLVPELAYIMSFPLKWKMGVLGVMNLDFCCAEGETADAAKEALVAQVVARQTELAQRAEATALLIAASLAKGKLQSVRLLRGL